MAEITSSRSPRVGKEPESNLSNISITVHKKETGEDVSVRGFVIEGIDEEGDATFLRYRGPFNQAFPEKTERFRLSTIESRREINKLLGKAEARFISEPKSRQGLACARWKRSRGCSGGRPAG